MQPRNDESLETLEDPTYANPYGQLQRVPLTRRQKFMELLKPYIPVLVGSAAALLMMIAVVTFLTLKANHQSANILQGQAVTLEKEADNKSVAAQLLAINSRLRVLGSAEFQNGVTVTGSTNLQTLAVAADAQVDGNLKVTGRSVLNGGINVFGNSQFNGTVAATKLSGDGSAITGVNAQNINQGTLSDTLLSTNVALLNNPNNFLSQNRFAGAVTLQSSLSGQSAVFASDVSALSFTQNGNIVCDASGNCATPSTTLNGLSGAISLVGTAQQVGVNTSGSTITLSLPQNIDASASPTFAGLTLTSPLTLANGGAVFDSALNGLSFSFGGRTYTLPNSGGANQTICTTGVTCASGGGIALLLAPGSAQVNNQNTPTIFINNTAGNNLLELQGNGSDKFVVDSNGVVSAAGTVTAGAFSGDGSALTNVNAVQLNGQSGSYYTNATNLSSGTVADGRLSTNVTTQGNTFNGSNQLVKLLASGLLPSLDGTNISSVNAASLQGFAASYFTNASNLSSGTVADARLSSNVALLGASNTFSGATNSFNGLSATAITQNGNAVCDASGNCAGAGGGVTTAGGTSGAIALFTNGNSIGNSIITQASTTITVAGTLVATALQGDGSGVSNLNAGNITTGTLGVAQGGTGTSSFTSGGVLYGNNAGALQATTAGTTGTCLVGNTSAAPSFQSCTAAASGTTPGGAASGDLSGSYPNPTVSGLAGTALSISSLVGGNFLVYNGTNWVNTTVSGDLTASSTGVLTIGSGKVTNLNLVNSSLTVSAGTGLSGGGSVALGGSTSLSVAYGSGAGTAVQGNTTLTCTAGTGNLSGGGTVVTLGTGGSCGSINTVASPSFSSINLGTALTVANGGTGAVTAAAARTNLGAAASGANSDITSLTAATNIGNASAGLTVGDNGQALSLQGNASSVFRATSGSYSSTVSFQAPTANVIYRFATAAAGSYDICTTIGNCAGSGGGITGSGTTNKLALFTGSGTIGDSVLSQSGTTITVGGTLAVNTIAPTSALLLGVTAQNVTLQGASVAITSTTGANTNTLSFATAAGGNHAVTIPNASGTVAVSASGPLAIDANGNITCTTCVTSGGGGGVSAVDSVNGLTGALMLQGTANQISISPSGNTLTLSLPQDINSGASPTFSSLSLTNGLSVTNAISADSLVASGTATAASFNGLSLTANGTGFSVAGGTAVRTLTVGANVTLDQDLSTTSSPTFASLSLSSALTVANGGTGAATAAAARINLGAAASGANSDITSLSGLTTTLSAGQGGTGVNGSTAGNGKVLIGNGSGYTLANLAQGSGISITNGAGSIGIAVDNTICTTAGNCAGSGTGVTTVGGTTGTIALFTASQAIGDSIISQTGSTVSVVGVLAATALQGDGSLITNINANNIGTGTLLSGRLTGTYSGLTGVGALTTGSIGTGFGTIATANTISTSAALQGNSLSIGSGAFAVNASGAITAAGGITSSGTITLSSLNATGVLHTNASGVLSTGTVLLGSETSGDYVASLGTLTGLSAGGSTGAGAIPTLSVTYGAAVNTAAQGNTALSFTGIGNLTGSVSGTAGGGLTTNTLAIVDNPTFSGLLSASGGLSVTGTNVLTVGSGTVTLGSLGSGLVQSSSTGVLSSGAVDRNDASFFSNQLSVTNGGTGLSGATAANGTLLIGNGTGYSLTTLSAGSGIAITNGAGSIDVAIDGSVCTTAGNCTGLNGEVTTAGGTTGTIALFSGSQAIGDSIISQASTTVTVAGTLSATALQGDGSAITNLNASNLASGTVGSTLLSGAYSGVTGTGTLVNGSIDSGFGSILTTNNIQGANLTATGTLSSGTSTTAGQLILANGNGTDTLINPGATTALSFTLPATSGTLCTTTTCAVGTGTNSYIQNGTSVQTGASFNIDGNGTVGGSFGVSGAITGSSTVNAVSGYKFNGTSGATTTCASGNVLQNAVIKGGIVTGGACVTNGLNTTLQNTYDNSGAINPQIQLSSANGGFKLRDASTTVGNIFQIQNATGGSTYFAVTATGASVAGTFSATNLAGDGSAITNLNASNLASGTVASSLVTGAYNGITGTGILASGSIASGFGSILTTNAIQGTTITATGALSSGTASTAGSLILANGNGTNTTINRGATTAQSFTLPATGGTLCTVTACASGTGGNGYIQNGTSVQTGASFNIDGNGTLGGALSSATINADSGYKFNGTAGSTTSCTGGTVLQNATVQGGIITGGNCVANGGGYAPTIQNVYDNSGTTNPQIQLSSANGGFKLRDASATVGNIFQIQDATGASTYFAVTSSGASVAGTFSATNLAGDGSAITNLNATNLASGTVTNARISGVYSNLTGTGALASGSIASGFGSIVTTNSIQGSNLVATGSVTAGSGLTVSAGGATIAGNVAITGASGVALSVRGAASQNVAEFKNSSGVTKVSIDATGTLAAPSLSVTSSPANNTGAVTVGVTNSGASGTVTTSGTVVALSGTNNATGNNVSNGISFSGVTAKTNNAFNGLYFADTSYDTILNVGGTSIINGTGKLQNAALDSSINYSNLQNVTSLTASGTLNAVGGFKFNGTAGSTTSCTSGNVLQNATVQGGIITGGSCVANGGGYAPTLQNVYDNSAATDPQIQLSSANGGFKLRDASTTVGNIFQIQNATGGSTYFAVTATGASVAGTFSAGGAVSAVGLNSGSGLIQGTGGVTATGSVQLNASGAGTTTIGNASAGAITIAAGAASTLNTGSNTLTVTSSNFSVTSAGAGTFSGAVQGSSFNNTASSFAVSGSGAITALTGLATSGAYVQSGTAANTFTGDTTFGNINSTIAYKFGGTAGVSTTCSGGNVLQNAVIQGGIVTAGSCAVNGLNTTLQGAYDNSTSPASILLANAKDFVVTAADTATDPNILFNLQCVTSCGSNGRFAVQNAGTDVFAVNPNGTIVIGNATNGISLSSSGYVLSGTARNARGMRLSAEYPGAVLDAGTMSNNSGTMTSGIDLTNRMNYYKWTTTQTTNQSYDIDVQVPIPKEFNGWASNPLTFNGYTSNTTNGAISIEARDSTNAVICNFVNVTPSSTGTWTPNNTACTLGTGTYTPGDYMTLRIRLQSPTGGDVRAGTITMSYLAKY